MVVNNSIASPHVTEIVAKIVRERSDIADCFSSLSHLL
jgi:hypothetical protein